MRAIIFFCFILAGFFATACMTTAVAQIHPSGHPAPPANLGFESGLDKKFSEASVFYWLYTVLVGAGAAVILLPRFPLLKMRASKQAIVP